MTEHLGTGEWERWRDDDREWKTEAMRHLIGHSERLAALETGPQRAQTAADTAESAKKWAIVGTTIGAVIHGIFLAFGGVSGR